MTKATVKTSHLAIDGAVHKRGDIIDISDEQILSMMPFVEKVVPTVAVLDERDATIIEMEKTIKALKDEIASAKPAPTKRAATKTAPKR